jgi:hypothetical protein
MTTTISATASIRVRGGTCTPATAAAVASALGGALGAALASAPIAVVDSKRNPSSEAVPA